MKHPPTSRLILLGAVLSLLLLGFLQPVRAELPPADTVTAEIDAFVAEQMLSLDIPGLALAVVRGGETLVLRGYGAADGAGRPVTPQTPFLEPPSANQSPPSA